MTQQFKFFDVDCDGIIMQDEFQRLVMAIELSVHQAKTMIERKNSMKGKRVARAKASEIWKKVNNLSINYDEEDIDNLRRNASPEVLA